MSTYQIQTAPQKEDIQILLSLLEKAEQIISLINLSDYSISKYNELKQLTFQKINIPFVPIIKRNSSPSSQTKSILNSNTQNLEILARNLYFNNQKKNMLLNLLMDFLENQPNINGHIKPYLQSLTDIYNLNPNITSKSLIQIEMDLKEQEKFSNDLFDKCDKLLNNSANLYSNMQSTFENKINNLKCFSDRQNLAINENLKKQSIYETDLINIREQYEKLKTENDQLKQAVFEMYDKYCSKNDKFSVGEMLQKLNNADECIRKLESVRGFLEKMVSDNIFLSDLVPSLQKDKLNLKQETNKPFVSNIIEKNDLMKEVCGSLNQVKIESDEIHKNFGELMKYIADKIESKL